MAKRVAVLHGEDGIVAEVDRKRRCIVVARTALDCRLAWACARSTDPSHGALFGSTTWTVGLKPSAYDEVRRATFGDQEPTTLDELL